MRIYCRLNAFICTQASLLRVPNPPHFLPASMTLPSDPDPDPDPDQLRHGQVGSSSSCLVHMGVEWMARVCVYGPQGSGRGLVDQHDGVTSPLTHLHPTPTTSGRERKRARYLSVRSAGSLCDPCLPRAGQPACFLLLPGRVALHRVTHLA
jgi:hypothetical protein